MSEYHIDDATGIESDDYICIAPWWETSCGWSWRCIAFGIASDWRNPSWIVALSVNVGPLWFRVSRRNLYGGTQ